MSTYLVIYKKWASASLKKSRKELCITIIYLVFFCKLVDRDLLLDKNRFVIDVKEEKILVTYLISDIN